MKEQLKYILLFSMLTFSLVGLRAQNNKSNNTDTIYVSGVVVDAATQEAIQGVRINSNGQFTALTDQDGKYKIRLPYAMATVTVSLEGYLTREIPVQGASTKNVALYKDIFISLAKNKSTFALTPAITVEDELQTRFAGKVRLIQRSAVTGIGSNMFIDGLNSLNMNSQPLIVVDGIIWENMPDKNSIHAGYYINSLANVDVNDIESVEVLKNASSIYGSKGANGAIIIKTIRSRSEVTKISFDAMGGLNMRPTLPGVMNADQHRAYASELLKTLKNNSAQINSYETTFLNNDKSKVNYSTYHNNTDWSDDVYQNGFIQRYGLNVQGGDDVAMYHISLGYLRGSSTVKESDFSRLNTRVNSDINLGKSIKIATNIYFSHLTRNLRDDGAVNRTSPTFISQIKSPFLIGYNYTTQGDRLTNNIADADIFNVSNPISLIENAIGKNTQYRFGISPTLEWSILKSLKLADQFSYSVENLKEHYFVPMLGVNPLAQTTGSSILNTVKDQTMRQISMSNDLNLAFAETFDYVHKIDAKLGFRISTNRFESSYGEGHNTGDDNKINLSRNLLYLKMSGVNDNWNSASLYLLANYTYKGRYNVWAVAASDASSRFGKQTKDGFSMLNTTWALFPSAGASWDISGESFMQQLTWLSNLSLRASYGISGNDDLGNMMRFSYLTPVNYLGAGVGLQIDNLGNQALQWETTSKLNAGIDIAILNDKINFSFDVFKNNTSNLLTLKQASKLTGLNYYWSNEGELENLGWSANVGAKLINNSNFKWKLEVSAAHYKNKILSLPDGDYLTEISGGEILTSVGNPAGLFYGYKTNGVFVSDAASREPHNGEGLKIQNSDASYSYFRGGDVYFDDKNNDGIINEKDKQVIGDPNPFLTGVVYNRFSMGRFDLDIALTYSLGNDVYNYQRSILESMSGLYNQSLAAVNRWKADGQITNTPKATYGDPMGNARFSDRWIEDGSFLKLKDVRLSYRLPIQMNFINGATVWVAGQNLYTWTKYLGSDPETSINSGVLYQGIDNGLLSAGRSVYVGLKLNL